MQRNHRSTRLYRALPACIPALLALSSGTSALAQTVSPEDIAAARGLGTEGTRLADTGDCNAAIPKLEAAEKLYHAPTTLDRLGECQISVGRIVAGTESLNRVVREPLAATAPPVFVAAQKRAQKALTAALPRIGNIKIHVDGASPDKLSLTVDGIAVPPALLDSDRPTDPGSHEVSASAAGYKTATTTVTVREGGESAVDLKLEVDPTAAAAAASSRCPRRPSRPLLRRVPPAAGDGNRTRSRHRRVRGRRGRSRSRKRVWHRCAGDQVDARQPLRQQDVSRVRAVGHRLPQHAIDGLHDRLRRRHRGRGGWRHPPRGVAQP